MKKVCVLISTYNGQRYLQEQLDSLFAQKGVEIRILARDDGSTDRTPDILRENAEANDCMSWYQGENLGPAKSFLRLLEDAPDADYYAFCDQDDVWDDDKLLCAVRSLERIHPEKSDPDVAGPSETDPDKSDPDMVGPGETDPENPAPDRPALYYSDLRIVDKDLRFIRTAHAKPSAKPARYTALAEPVATGCTMVMNRAAADLLKSRLPDRCKMHDEWAYLVISLTGETVYDPAPHISYRQHDGNVLSIRPGTGSLKVMKAKRKRMRSGSWIHRSEQAGELCRKCSDILTEKDIRMAEKMARYRETVPGRLRLLLEPRIHGSTPVKDLEYRIKVILGIA